MIVGNNRLIQTTLTSERCIYNRGHCTLRDRSVTIWNVTDEHNFNETETLGRHHIMKLGRWIAIPQLKRGGVIQTYVNKHAFILDGGLMIVGVKENDVTRRTICRDATEYFKKVSNQGDEAVQMLGMHLTVIISTLGPHI